MILTHSRILWGGRRLSASLCTFIFPLIQAAPKARLFRILLVCTSLALCLNISSQIDRLVSLQTRRLSAGVSTMEPADAPKACQCVPPILMPVELSLWFLALKSDALSLCRQGRMSRLCALRRRRCACRVRATLPGCCKRRPPSSVRIVRCGGWGRRQRWCRVLGLRSAAYPGPRRRCLGRRPPYMASTGPYGGH